MLEGISDEQSRPEATEPSRSEQGRPTGRSRSEDRPAEPGQREAGSGRSAGRKYLAS